MHDVYYGIYHRHSAGYRQKSVLELHLPWLWVSWLNCGENISSHRLITFQSTLWKFGGSLRNNGCIIDVLTCHLHLDSLIAANLRE